MTLPARAQEPGTTTTIHTDGAGAVRRTVLPGGLRIITESMPTVRSAAFGIWSAVGSRDEAPADAGASHYLEHVLFKGTRRRSALEISAAIDAVGGDLNAFTAKEYTCYYARVLDADLPLAVDVVSDMVAESVNRPEDVEAERGVILEEIHMRDDDPGDLIHDEFATALYGDTPLGRPILGTEESINALSRDRIHGYYREHYVPSRLVVSVAGNIDHDEVVRLVSGAFAEHLAGDAAPAAPRLDGTPVPIAPRTVVIDKDTEQAHIILGGAGTSRTDERRFALGVLNAALGGGMSSRLFQEIREKRGLAYSVYSYTAQYADTGIFGVYAGCQPAKAEEVLAICRDELHKAVEESLTAEELERGKGQLRGAMVLGLEDTGSRMSRIGKSELVYESLLPVDEVLARIEAVTLDDVRAVAAEVLAGPRALTVIGPVGDRDFTA
ncbi:M16 family metallopeptidase [Actinomadura madurae]|uniref:M16 family metallopeptidase n=1 Tax=Actinomadura madurae TaxID=1993 RepID=UPI002025E27B|nr:pitrilysin family protein [Actinomadura madurae]MCQ0004684.1 insulinase family protein [Actinomadura madurae]URN02182.1 insulinase family protein [Actinomadura madurae]